MAHFRKLRCPDGEKCACDGWQDLYVTARGPRGTGSLMGANESDRREKMHLHRGPNILLYVSWCPIKETWHSIIKDGNSSRGQRDPTNITWITRLGRGGGLGEQIYIIISKGGQRAFPSFFLQSPRCLKHSMRVFHMTPNGLPYIRVVGLQSKENA